MRDQDEIMQERMAEAESSIGNMHAWATGQATPLQRCIEEEHGIPGLVDALVDSYRTRREEIEHRHDGDTGWEDITRESLKEFDESVEYYEVALFCAIAHLTTEGIYFEDVRKHTFENLLEMLESKYVEMRDSEVEPIGKVRAVSYPFSFYDSLRLMHNSDERLQNRSIVEWKTHPETMGDDENLKSWVSQMEMPELSEEDLFYISRFDKLDTYYEQATTDPVWPLSIYRPVRCENAIGQLHDRAERMVNTYLYRRGYSLMGDAEVYRGIIQQIADVSRTAWKTFRELQEA